MNSRAWFSTTPSLTARMLILILALQLGPGSAALAGESPRQMLRNQGLPVPAITRLQVEQAMKASSAVLTAQAETAAASAPETVAEPQAAQTETSQSQAPETLSEAAAAPAEPAAVATESGGTATEAPASSDGASDRITPSQALALNFGPGSIFYDGKTPAPRILNGVIVIDNDEEEEQETTIAYNDLPTDDGGTKVKAGARFPVVVVSEISSKTAKKGDPLNARLKYDLKIGDRLIAKKGSMVVGHINYALKARTILHSLVSPERWYRNSGCVGIAFDEIINEKNEHIPLLAQPARKSRIVKNKGEGRVLGVNHNGQITGPWSQQLRYKAIRVGLNFALAPAGVFSFGAMPVALGVIGAVNPSFAFSKPVGLNVRHRRLKGFAWGFLSGIPGSFLIEDTVVKGQEAVIKPGDEFLAEMKQEFTGEPETEASLMPNASTKVRGQVVDEGKSTTKTKKK